MGGSVLVASTGKNPERPKTLRIPIERPDAARKRVVLSLGPAERSYAAMPDLAHGDEIRIGAELEVTTDAPESGPASVAVPYGFDPRIEAELLLASSQDAARAAGGRAVRIGRPQQHVCLQSEHHHVVFFGPDRYRLTLDGQLPWTGPSHVNLALVATHNDARPGQVLLIGQNEPATRSTPAHAEGNMAKLSVIRFRGKPQPKGRTIRATSRRATTIPIRHGSATVVRSIQLGNLAPHDQLVVTARLRTRNPHDYPARISTRIILADSRSTVDLGGHAGEVASYRGEVTKENGTNCLAGKTALTRKVGVLRILKPADRPLFINHVATSADPEGGAGTADRLDVLDDGYLEVVRYRAADSA